MKKTKYLIITLLLSSLLSNKVNAYCTQWERNHFKEIESQYKATYNYDETTGLYSITYYMPEPHLYSYRIAVKSKDFDCSSPNRNTVVCTGKDFYGIQEFVILGNTNTCNDELKREKIEIPEYKINKYYNTQYCEGIEEFVLCQKEYTEEITEEDFIKRSDIYKESKLQKEQEEENKPKKETISNEKIEKNSYITIIVLSIMLIGLLIITISLKIKAAKESRQLEWVRW